MRCRDRCRVGRFGLPDFDQGCAHDPDQSKTESAASRALLNNQLTCGFCASVWRSGCTEKGQEGALGGDSAAGWRGMPPLDPPTGRQASSRKNAPDLIRRGYSARRLRSRAWPLRQADSCSSFKTDLSYWLRLDLLCAQTATAQSQLGAQGAEGEPNRRQQWLVPSPDLATTPHALLFRPPGDGPFRLAVIAHASTQNVLRRAQMPQPEYRALAAWLVARGFAVLVPERPGHGATGGKYLEDQGGCDEADYASAGRATADAIAASVGFVRKQPFIRQDGMVVIGHSAGAWGALALAGEKPARRRGHHRVCAGPRRPRQRPAQPGLRAAYADLGRGRIRQRPRGCR